MKKVLRCFGRIMLVLIIFSFVGADAWGLGQLKLIAKTEDGKIKLSLTEEEGHFFGEIREGITVVTPIEIILEATILKIIIGEQDYLIERREQGKLISYGGVIQDDRGISAQVKINGPILTISGTMENEKNTLIDFKAIANDQIGSLELRWDENYLFINKIDEDKPGGCQGGLVKKDLATLGSFWCSSSGSLENAFFNDPDQILTWLVTLFVN